MNELIQRFNQSSTFMQFYTLAVIYGVLFFVTVAIIQVLWNFTIPQITQWNKITYWQAFRLTILVGLLTGTGAMLQIHLN